MYYSTTGAQELLNKAGWEETGAIKDSETVVVFTVLQTMGGWARHRIDFNVGWIVEVVFLFLVNILCLLNLLEEHCCCGGYTLEFVK